METKSKDLSKKLSDYWEAEFKTTYRLKDISAITLNYLRERTKGLKPGVLLDNGCGTGRIKRYFETIGWECYGTDISQAALRVASKDTPLNLVHAPSSNLPFKDGCFDLVISFRVLHNMPSNECARSLREIVRVMRRSALCLVVVQAREDLSTYNYYLRKGKELPRDKGSVLISRKVAGQKHFYLKHFFSEAEVKALPRKVPGRLKIERVEQLKEPSGFKELRPHMQTYWAVVLRKVR